MKTRKTTKTWKAKHDPEAVSMTPIPGWKAPVATEPEPKPRKTKDKVTA